MPQVIAGYLAANAFAYAVIYVVATIAITAGLSALAKSMAGKERNESAGGSRDVTIKGTVEPRQLIYGEIRTSGVVAFYGLASGGADLYFVIAVAGHQCENISDCWLDSQRIPDADINPASGEVTTAEFMEGATSKLYIWRYLGTDAQTADGTLSFYFPEWDAAHRGRGVAYVIYRMSRSEAVYTNGAPGAFFSLVKGRRLYDPRLDSTNGGSGSHRANDATTWSWSDNSVLARRDYVSGGAIVYDVATPDKRLGLGEIDARIDDAYTIAAANIADETPLIPPASPTTTQKRYTCNVQISCDNTHRENMEVLESADNGHLSYVKGKYRFYVGAYDAPTVDLDEDDILGPVEVVTHPNGEDVYNLVSGTFFDEARNWQQSDFPPVTDSGYQTDDGGLKTRTVQLYGTRTSFRAQRIAIQILKQSRNKTIIKFTQLSPKAMNIAEWETFRVSISEFGYTLLVLRCLEWTFDCATGFIAITARIESSSAYSDPAVATYSDPATNDPPTVDIEEPDAPTSLTATTFVNAIRFAVGLPAYYPAGAVVELWEHTANTPFSSATKLWEARSSVIVVPKRDETTRYYWARIRLQDGQVSDTFPASNGGAGVASFVETGDIEPNAATELHYTAAGNLSGFSPSTVYRDLTLLKDGGGTPITSGNTTISLTALAYNAVAIVTGNFSGSKTGGSVVIYPYAENTTDATTTVGDEYSLTATPTHITMQYEFSMLAGKAYRIGLRALSDATTNTEDYAEPITVQIEVIKR